MTGIPVTADELHAFVDGELPPDRLDAVEAWLATHPEDAARVAAWRSIGEAVHRRYDAVADEAVPKRLEIDRLARQPRRWLAASAAALIAFAAGGALGWTAREATIAPTQTATLTGEALAAYTLYTVEVRHPVEVAGSDRKHLTQWLSKRLGYDVRAPELDSAGLTLVGGRLLPGPKAPAAFLMYEGKSGERFTIYCSRSASADSQMRYRSRDRAAAMTWSDNGVGFVVSGPDDHHRIQQVASLVYDQVERSGEPVK